MSTKYKLVRNDTGPQFILSLKDTTTGAPIDVSAAGTTIVFKFRAVGSSTIKNSISAGKLTGLLNDDGSITTTAPYNVAGAGGRIAINWPTGALDTAGEFEAEVEITFADGTIQTVYDTLKFSVREDF